MATDPKSAAVGWWLYFIRMPNGSLYCGVTIDVTRRFSEHCSGGAKAAKSLRGKGPLELAFTYFVGEKKAAMALEWQVKRWPKAKKEALVLGRVLLS